jgi:hypothetical protein
LRARPSASPSLAIVSTSAGPRTIMSSPSSILVIGRPVTGSSAGSPSMISWYDSMRPVPVMDALRSSLSGSLWHPVQVFAPRFSVKSGATCVG